jgi:hypothetical protein
MTGSIVSLSRGLIVALFAVLTLGGCTHKYKLDAKPITEWPAHERLPLRANLVLTDEFASASMVKKMMGDKFVFPIGEPLVVNAEAMAREAFQQVTVTRGSAANAGSGVDCVLTPTLSGAEQGMSAWAFDPVDLTIDVEWRLTDAAGKPLWVQTVRGVTRDNLGNAFTHKKEARQRVNKTIQDLYRKSLLAITSAPEARRLASK